MNSAAFFDGVLALVALWLAIVPGRSFPAVRLAALILAAAACLGTLRFSGLLPLPEMHQLLSTLGANTGFPLIAVVSVWPLGAVARTQRYAWIGAIVLAVAGMLFTVVAPFKLWTSGLAILSALSILGLGLRRKESLLAGAGLAMLAALLAFSAKFQLAGLAPGDLLHLGLSASLILFGVWLNGRDTAVET